MAVRELFAEFHDRGASLEVLWENLVSERLARRQAEIRAVAESDRAAKAEGEYRRAIHKIEDASVLVRSAEQKMAAPPADHAFLHLDAGIKRAVLALNAAGIPTIESCEGGEGHAFLEPTISFRGDMNEGLMAVAILRRDRFKVWELRRRWRMAADEIDGPFWDVVLVEKDNVSKEETGQSAASSSGEGQTPASCSGSESLASAAERPEDSRQTLSASAKENS